MTGATAAGYRHPVTERRITGLPAWGDPFTFGGLPGTDRCPAGDGPILRGERARGEAATGLLWHDRCIPPESLTPASAPSGKWGAGAGVTTSGGADGAAGRSASAVPDAPAAPSPP